MSNVMLVNVTHVEESRVAILDDGVLAAYEIETINRTNIKGNIYNAVVESVHATLEAAFVKLAPDLKGFLPLDGVNFKLLPARGERGKTGRIGQHLHPGQRLMAQVVREPFAGKPPTVSTYFSLPGRFLVLMPGVDSSGISRKIEDAQQRERLKSVVDELKLPDGFGLIVRTAGIGQTKTELQRDLRYLLRLWESVQKGSKGGEFPGLVYREADLVIRTIRDFMTPDISEVWIDSKDTYETALRFVRDVMPNRARTVKLYTGDRPLFNKFNLEEQIERIYKRRVPLPSGGEIVIDGTEALTAIDVNSARSKRQGDIEDNNLQTNLEAASELTRQLRLRDLGGLIVVDFIDMAASRNRSKVEKAMRDAMRGDRAKYDLTRLSKLGLMEIARQRLKGAKMASTYATCVACEGYGLVKNVETAALAALRKLQTRSARANIGLMRVALPHDVATWLLNHKREELMRIEQRHSIRVEIVPSSKLLRHESEFEAVARERTDAVDEPPAREPRSEIQPDTPRLAPPPRPPIEPGEEKIGPRPLPAPVAAVDQETRRAEPRAEVVSESADVDGQTTTEPPPVAPTNGELRAKRRRRRRRRGRAGAPPPADGQHEPASPKDEP
ncbi:MAG TPA: Rne/Rng family ribonuclease, partial [Candidatus Polarisedimenticolaceae bacterium]|nr:Rne/Rng family ribonuclease [Candidatus Polarisedimenticolaceae bacterium]